jgi:hypothetical protein
VKHGRTQAQSERSSAGVRRQYTDRLKSSGASDASYRAWTNYVYKSVLGMDADGIRQRAGAGRSASARSLLSSQERAQVLRVEQTVSSARGQQLAGVHRRAVARIKKMASAPRR